MTQAQENEYQRFLALAARDGIKVLWRGHVKATGQVCYGVSSSKSSEVYIVIAGVVCTCKAHGLCKHRALVRHELILASDKARQLEQERLEREREILEREQEIDRALYEAEHASDVYDAFDDEPLPQIPAQGKHLWRTSTGRTHEPM